MSVVIAVHIKDTAGKNYSGLTQKISHLVKWPKDFYYDCCAGVTGIGMLVEEANDRATKPWYQRVSET